MARYTPSNLSGDLGPVNPELEKIKLAIEGTLSRKGDSPNAMIANIDMNSNRIINAPSPLSPSELANKKYVDDIVKGSSGLVVAGTYKSVADMVADNSLVAGDVVATSSYYEGLAEGGATYKVVTTAQYAGTPDEVSDHTIGNGLVAVLSEHIVTPEMCGSDGTAAKDSAAVVSLLAKYKNILFQSGKTYKLDVRESGSRNAWEILNDDTVVTAYGATIELRGTDSNNGIRIGDRTNVSWFGGYFTNPENLFTSNISMYGQVKDITIRDCDSINSGQYHILAGGDDASYDGLYIDNCKAFQVDSQNNNAVSMCYEFYPRAARNKNLVFTNNYAEMVGKGNCFKIHNSDYNYIYGNTFVRTSNVTDSLSQAVHLSGRYNTPCNYTVFSNNVIDDSNSTLRGLYFGSDAEDVIITNNVMRGAGDTMWLGNGINRCIVQGNKFSHLQTVGGLGNNDINKLKVIGNDFIAIEFRSGNSVSPPRDIASFDISENRLGYIRLNNSGTSSGLSIRANTFSTGTDTIIDSDNVTYSNNFLTVVDGASLFQPVYVNGDGYKSSNNIFNLKGICQRATFLNGNNSEVIGDTVYGVTVEAAGSGGTGNKIEFNKYSVGGVWQQEGSGATTYRGFGEIASSQPTDSYLPSGWSFTGYVSGQITVTHNLGLSRDLYQVFVQGLNGNPLAVDAKTNNSFRIGGTDGNAFDFKVELV